MKSSAREKITGIIARRIESNQLPIHLQEIMNLLTNAHWHDLNNDPSAVAAVIGEIADAFGLTADPEDQTAWNLASHPQLLESRVVTMKYISPTSIKGHVPRPDHSRRKPNSDREWDDNPSFNIKDA